MNLRKFVFLLVAAADLTSCTEKVVLKETKNEDAYCAGRYTVAGPPSMHVDGARFSYYWGDISTWSESASAYTERLTAAQRAAESAGKLVATPVHTDDNSGMLMLTYEDDAPPFDPNTTVLSGYAHRDGVTLEFKKRTINRLLAVTQLRAREIMGALRPRPADIASLSNSSFCAGDGVITLVPQTGWYEATEINGTFSIGGHRYKFLFSANPLKSKELSQNDLSARRATMAEMADAKQVGSENEAPAAQGAQANKQKNAMTQMLSAQDSAGRQFIIYEWRGIGASTPNDDMVPYLYIWSVAGTDSTKSDAQLLKVAHDSSTDTPLYIRFSQLPKGQNLTAQTSRPVPEESRVPYSMRITYPGRTSSASRRPYSIYRNGELVYKGRSDKDGFTEALNADYLEKWEIKAFN